MRAGEINQKIDSLSGVVELWKSIESNVEDLRELVSLDDNEFEKDIKKQYTEIKNIFDENRVIALFQGEHDSSGAIFSIQSGAGGVDAQDFAMMLERMYLRYFEKKDWNASVIERSVGSEAGIKKVVFEVKALYGYGYLKAESGIHRLVRLSPFNSDNLRQTSFASVEVIPIIENSDEIEIKDDDLKIDTFRAQGKGGQGVNTTDSAVRITHIPSGTVVTCQNERSQLQNKATALKVLKSRLIEKRRIENAKDKEQLRGDVKEVAFGSQIRSYVLHPYKQIKDHRTNHVEKNVEAVLDGDIDNFIKQYLELS